MVEKVQQAQTERLKTLLNNMGIHSEKDIDKALDGLTIGIITDPLIHGST